MIIYNTSLDEYSKQHISKELGTILPPSIIKEQYKNYLASLCEQLLLYDKISLKVSGANYPLAILLEELGYRQVYDLIEEGVIEFFFDTSMSFIVTNDNIERRRKWIEEHGKYPPIMTNGYRNEPAYTSPEGSINEGLKIIKKKVTKNALNTLIKIAANSYVMPDKNLVSSAPKLVEGAYDSNDLANVGLEKNKELYEFEYEDKVKLHNLASDVWESMVLARYNYSSLNMKNPTYIFNKSYENIQKAVNIQNRFGAISGFEALPNLKSLFFEGKIRLVDIVEFRHKSNSIRFRNWLEKSTNSKDIEYTTRMYLDSIDTPGYFDKAQGKFAKFGVMYAIGTLVSGATQLLTAGSSTPAQAIGGQLASIGLGLFEQFCIERQLKNWNPRMFIQDYRKKIEVH